MGKARTYLSIYTKDLRKDEIIKREMTEVHYNPFIYYFSHPLCAIRRRAENNSIERADAQN